MVATVGGECPAEPLLTRFSTGSGDRGWGVDLNGEPLVLDLVSKLNQPWYAGIFSPRRSEGQEESEMAAEKQKGRN